MRHQPREGFYKELLALMVPIAVQNLVGAAVNTADVLMVGQLNQTALSASSLAGQVQFVINFIFFGVTSSVTILAAQYWGKGDRRVIAKIFGLGLYLSLFFTTIAGVLCLAVPRFVMSIWTNDAELIETGARYLRLVAPAYFFAGITHPYLAVMKSCERVRFSMLLSIVTLGLNVILNAVLIFGLFGFPELGIEGAAIATTISRGAELLICAVDFSRQKIFPHSPAAILALPRSLIADFCRYALPAFINDVLWGFAFNMNSVIMGRLGSDIVAANSIVTVVRDLITTVGFGMSSAAAIMLGKSLGMKKPERALTDSASLVRTTFRCGLVSGALIALITPILPHVAKVSETAGSYMIVMMLISAVYQMGQLINTLVIAAILRCGGDTKYGMALDIITMWGWAVPVGLLAAFVFRFPPLVVYAFMCTDEFVKMPFALRRYKSRKWLNNITREHGTGE